jgi:protein-L-isoaspartate(D-aspartate) O-methyltransferase
MLAKSAALCLALALTLAVAGPALTKPDKPQPDCTQAQLQDKRSRMVEAQIKARDIKDQRVLTAMQKVPRHCFVPAERRKWAYADHPLPIGYGQTISQPYIVALMTQALNLAPGEKVLEIGTGSGYQAAVLAELTDQVYSIEIVPELGKRAAEVLAELGYARVHLRIGDGYKGWYEAAPFKAIILTAAPPKIPKALIDQLDRGGRMILPLGPDGATQELLLLRKDGQGHITRESLGLVRFVPMVPGS